MAVVITSNLRKEIAGTPLFDGVSFKVERRDRVALSGPNGAGKTTLLRILAGETEAHGGELAFAKGTRVALHDQRPPLELGLSLREYALGGAGDLLALEERLRELESKMEGGSHDPGTMRAYADAQARLEHAGGYAWREHAAAVVRGLGFAEADLDRPLTTFSGGELTRASLARALSGGPDLLLLDEPTNHLDVANIEWLERELQSLDAGVILVAHDRWFLESVTNAVLELEGGRSIFFAGPWHNWRREKAARSLAAAKSAERYAEDIARLERFVERFRYKKSKAKQAQAKLTQISRLGRGRAEVASELHLLTARRRTLGFDFLQPARSGRTVVEVEGISLAAGGKHLLADVSFALERAEHVALVGPNGAGKTTLLEAILGRRQVGEGSVRLGYGVETAYFSQHETELDTRAARPVSPESHQPRRAASPHQRPKRVQGAESVLDCAQRTTGLKRPEAQKLLGRFLFSGWTEHDKPVTALSGGERRRLALALVVASGANFLVLDEPTNHLDLESREALEAALESFPGTVLIVSHDRALLDAVARRMLAIEDGSVHSYDGGWAEYVRRREEVPVSAPATSSEPKPKEPRPEGPKAARPTELELIEAKIAHQEEAVAELERRLADDWRDVETLAAHRRARDELRSLLTRWEELFEQAQA
jgi:ATP-binding cassette subfamily F protein 3